MTLNRRDPGDLSGIVADVTAPRTAAGQELWDHMRNWFDDPSPELILAIEAEASRATVERIRAKVGAPYDAPAEAKPERRRVHRILDAEAKR